MGILIDGKVPQSFIFISCCGKMLKKSYILNFTIDAKFNIGNKIFVISVLALGGVVFDCLGVIPPRKKHCLK